MKTMEVKNLSDSATEIKESINIKKMSQLCSIMYKDCKTYIDITRTDEMDYDIYEILYRDPSTGQYGRFIRNNWSEKEAISTNDWDILENIMKLDIPELDQTLFEINVDDNIFIVKEDRYNGYIETDIDDIPVGKDYIKLVVISNQLIE